MLYPRQTLRLLCEIADLKGLVCNSIIDGGE